MSLPLTPPGAFFLASALACQAIRVHFAVRARRAGGGAKFAKAPGWDRVLIALVGLGQFVLPAGFLFTPWLDGADFALPAGCFPPGAALTLAGLWLFWRAHADLGESWSVTLELNREHRLVTRGVYRRMRHPMYASFLVLGLGQGLLLANWLAGWAGLASVALLVAVRLPREEAMMVGRFGDEYRAYQARTGAVWPRRS
ncbi:MAG: protein-S-isoprenylcysteine O-methyltransferase [Burkholderiaceae bacterium]